MIQRLNSIRLRLAAFAILVVFSTMLVTWFGLSLLFERHVERREGQGLDVHLQHIIGGLRFRPDGSVKLARDLADPRFGKVFGGGAIFRWLHCRGMGSSSPARFRMPHLIYPRTR